MRELHEVNAIFRGLAEQAGAKVLEHYSGDIATVEKSDGSPLTAADLASDEVIRNGLAESLPDYPVVSEEAVLEGLDDPQARFILVDPLDGTKEFLKKTGEFTVNIALIEGGRPIAGVVYAPAMGKLWSGHQGGAAELRTGERGAAIADSEPVAITTREAPASGGLVAVASRSHLDPGTEAFLSERGIVDRASIGSSLKFCLVAQGDADVYPRLAPTMAWDTAAGHAVLAAAGGMVCTSEGAPLRYAYGERGWLNPHFIAWSSEALKQRLMPAA